MAVKVYNKLVRDKIPEIIEADGKCCKTEILSDEEYIKMIDAKLDEELAEYHEDQNIEELADLMELYTRRQDIVNLARLDSEFHEIIYDACKSRTLKHILASLHQNLSRARRSSLNSPNRAEKSLEEHRAIMEAIENHLPEEAKACMQSHIRHAGHTDEEHNPDDTVFAK